MLKATESAFCKELTELQVVIRPESQDVEEAVTLLQSLRGCYDDLTAALENDAQDASNNDDDDAINALVAKKVAYRRDMCRMEREVAKIAPKEQEEVSTPSSHRVFLPQRKLEEFSGDVREWLPFWTSFQDLHDDTKMPVGEKLQLLLGCIPKGSPARKCIEGFAISVSNYGAMVDALRNMYGRPKTLIKVYVRDMLDLVKTASEGGKTELVDLYPKLSSHIRNLETLGVTQDNCESILYPVVESCLPDDVLQAWQRNPGFEDKLEKLLEFLKLEVNNSMDRALAKMQFNPAPTVTSGKKSFPKGEKEPQAPTAAAFAVQGKNGGDKKVKDKQPCPFCDDARHSGERCYKAKTGMNFKEKMDKLKTKRCCFKCFRTGHGESKCTRDVTCFKCFGEHYSVVCPKGSDGQRGGPAMMAIPQSAQDFGYHQQVEIPQQGQMIPLYTPNSNQQQPFPGSSSHHQTLNGQYQQQMRGTINRTSTKASFSDMMKGRVILETFLAVLTTPKGRWNVRVFVDRGSMESYIETWCASECGCVVVGEQHMQHELFGAVTTEIVKHTKFEVNLSSMDGKHQETFVVNSIPKISTTIEKPEIGNWSAILEKKGIKLEDQSCAPDGVHIMMGMDTAARIKTGGYLRITDGLEATETVFGWIIGGVVPLTMPIKLTRNNLVTSNMLEQCSVDELWSLEALGIKEDPKSQTKEDIEQATIAHFQNTIRRNEDGRYVASLPFKDGHRKLSGNFNQAFSRLKKVTADLQIQGYWSAYHKVFEDWEGLGVIAKADDNVAAKVKEMYLLPHHHVIKESSATTPVRPVLDASAKGKGGPSLNEILEKGPNLLEQIPDNLCKFRKEVVAATADVAKAYLQIEVDEKDQEVLHFLWWKDESCTELQLYRHCRVVFGVKPSAFILAATINHHVEKFEKDAEFKKKLLGSLYVDNSNSSHPSKEAALEFQKRSQELLLPAHFDLRAWEFSGSSESKLVGVLGMQWETREDKLMLSVDEQTKKEIPATKRGLLSLVNSIYDPLGIACAVTVLPKMWLQECVELELDWDQEIPAELQSKLKKWHAELEYLAKLEIPRWLGLDTTLEGVSIHCFVDACATAYACYIFVRKEVGESVRVSFVMGKSRVAPLKQRMTIPKLELMACQIGAKLTVNSVVAYLELDGAPVHFWSDSTTALTWITVEKEWPRFVKNRVGVVRGLTQPGQWHHVAGEINPADVPSRGCSAKKLVASHFWSGPSWLKSPEAEWPKSDWQPKSEEVEHEKEQLMVTCHAKVKRNEFLEYLLRFSSYNKMLRVLAMMLRFLEKITKKTTLNHLSFVGTREKDSDVDAKEMDCAERILLIMVQQLSFAGVEDSRLRNLDPFLHNDGLIRIKSQLLNGEEKFGVRCPIVLPSEHEITKRLIRATHFRNCHEGVKYLQGLLREKFWILRSYRTINSVLHSCWCCKRFAAKRLEVPPSALPADRVRDGVAFAITRVDLAGPLMLSNGQKVWIVLFTCALYRAVHLELVSSLSTQGFLMAFQRFASRRGRPSTIYSDNGLNFVGCKNAFEAIDWKEVLRYAAVERIQWILNPPAAPWWGGFWERLIGMMKQMLRRVLGKRVVNAEELTTMLCEVELCLNRRPLTFMSDKRDELLPLCPDHFLKDNAANCLPEVEVLDGGSLNERVRLCAKLRDDLRRRFRKEYLAQLQHRGGKRTRAIRPGDIVIVEEDNKKRLLWKLGLILEVYVGKDGNVRKALVRTKDGHYLRPVQRLFLMEASEETVDEEETGVAEIPELEQEPESAYENMETELQHVEEEPIPRSRFGRAIVKPDRFM